ncbi:MAG: hypothetical protein KGJ05_00280, partial [Alphaproteobacteria bacterium]|nr:hypothetical protein [Alphaproteobacteria bacterium]
QTAMTKKDYPTALTNLDKAEPIAKTPYEHFLIGMWRAISGQSLKNDATFNAGLDEVVTSGYAKKPDVTAQFALISGQNAYNAKNYDKAIQRLQLAQQLGSTEPNLVPLIAESYIASNRTAQGMAVYEKMYTDSAAAGKPMPQDMMVRARTTANDARLDSDVQKWSIRLVQSYPSPTMWHDLIILYIQSHPKLSFQATVDLYRLMRATHSFKENPTLSEYAGDLVDKLGLPGEAKAAIDQARTDGVITTMSADMSSLYNTASAKIPGDKASLRATAATPRAARGNGDGWFSYGDYAKALTLYNQAKGKPGIEPDGINMRIGMAQALSGDKANAKASFASVGGEEADIAKFWSLYVSS